MGQGRPRVDLKDMRGGLEPGENVSGCGMRRAEVQSSKNSSYGATIPLMEGVRDVVGEVSGVTRTLHWPCKPRRGRASDFTGSDRRSLRACADGGFSGSDPLWLKFSEGPLAAVWEW